MATRFWVGGGSSTNWSATANTNWAATSGGANNASVPTTGDAVVFDASSGAGTSVMDVALSLIAMDCNGFTGTLTHNVSITLTISGNDAGAPASNTLRFSSGMTYTAASNSRLITMTSTSGTSSITCNGKTIGSLTCNGVGGTFQQSDSLLIRSDGTLTLTNGTFNANGFDVTAGFVSSNNSNTRTMTMGSGTWTLAGFNGNLWDYTTTTGLTHTPTAAPIIWNINNPNGGSTFVSGGKSYGPLTINGNVSGGTQNSRSLGSGSPTFAALTINSSCYLNLSNTITITGALTINGSAFNSMVQMQGPSGAVTVTFNLGAASAAAWAYFNNITVTGAGALTTTNCLAISSTSNSGFVVNGPSAGGGGSQKVFGS